MRIHRRDWKQIAIVLICALTVAACAALPVFARWHTLDIDILHAIRHALSPPQKQTHDSPVTILAIDEYTHRTSPFAGLPKVMWTPQIAAVQDAVLNAGATVIGWDLILPTSAATYVADRNFDRPLLQSLARGAQNGRIVLGMADIGVSPIKPHTLYTWAAGGATNLRLLNVVPDPDGVVRRVPVSFLTHGQAQKEGRTPSFARELAQRHLDDEFTLSPEDTLSLKGNPVSGVRNGAILLNFDANASNVPTFSLADLHACLSAGKTEFFKRHFAQKTVLIGLVLDIEDRKLSSARLFTGGAPPGPVTGCVTPPSSLSLGNNDRATLPGVYLHAVAINNLIQGSGLETLSPPLLHLPSLFSSVFAALAAGFLSLPVSTAVIAFGGAAWALTAVVAFNQNLVLPLIVPLASALVTLTVVFALRFSVIDKDARFLRKAFASYMAPTLVEQLVDDPERLKLSGELREMTFLFTDLAGFTSLIEKQHPEDSVKLLNEYLAGMVDIAKLHGGTLDKVVGDALHIIFSAPLDQQDHAQRALECALEMDRFANSFSEQQKALGIPFGETRIGVNSGTAIIGNFGGREFFDYTAHGDAINTAARLESANKQFGTRLAISGSTVTQCNQFSGRPIGSLVLKGKTVATEVFEPLCDPENQQALFDEYTSAFNLLARGSKKAGSAFASLAKKYPGDGLTQFHLTRLNAGETGTRIVLEKK